MTRGEKGTLTLYDELEAKDAVAVYLIRGCKVKATEDRRKHRYVIKVDCPHPIPRKMRAMLKRVRVMKNGYL